MAATDSQQQRGIPFDAYGILGVPEDADKDLIKTAYRRSAIKCHPDKFTDPIEKAAKEIEFKTLLLAYDTLIQKDSRTRYNYTQRLPPSSYKKYHDVGANKEQRGDIGVRDNHGGIARARDDDPNKRHGIHGRQAQETKGVRKRQRESGMLVTAGLIEHHQVHAMPDTGAGLNLISSSLAEVLGYSRPAEHIIKGAELRMANGKNLKTIGVIEAAWSFFPEAKETWKLRFHIVQDFFYDAVLGNDFLMFTQTMSKYQHRLSRIPVPMKALSVLFINTLGRVKQRLRGFIDNVQVDALPDSGSESNLISLDYCRAKGWGERLRTGDTRLLLFPDGSIQQTQGTISLRWAYGSTDKHMWDINFIMLEFHVLFDCVYDAILGQEMLEDTSAFESHQDSFFEVHEPNGLADSEQGDLNLVIWLPFRGTKRKVSDAGLEEGNTGSESSVLNRSTVHSELERRAAAESAIRRLHTESERKVAMAKEVERRRDYDAAQARLYREMPSSGVSRVRHRGPESVN